MKRIVGGIEGIQALPAGWDSYGGKAIDETAAQTAVALIAALSQSPQIVPLGTGGIQIEWRLDGIEVEITIDPTEPGQISGHIWRGSETCGDGTQPA